MRDRMTTDAAAALALTALAHLVASGDDLDRFMATTGADPASLRAGADELEFQASILDFMLANEPLLLDFCDKASTDVRAVHMARHVLGGG